MNLKPISSEQEYEAALARIEYLWNAKPDPIEADELGELVDLVRDYEAEKHPVPPPDPDEAIKFRKEQMGAI